MHNVLDIHAALARDPDIEYIEPDGFVHAMMPVDGTFHNATRTNATLIEETFPIYSQDLTNNATNETVPLDWLDGTVDDQYQYAYTGHGVKVYIIDSGIEASHPEFRNNDTNTSRITCGLDLRTNDCHDAWGHGTHIASTIGGNVFGVAKQVEMVAVKVLADDGTARFSDVIAGLEYVYLEQVNATQRAVVNLSLGTSRVAAMLNAAVEQLVQANVPVIVAAGNGRTDACSWSPASADSVIAVAALQSNYHMIVPSSNYGKCISMYAPGDWIEGAWHNGTYRSVTGTSMAAPFITGGVALYLERNDNLTVPELIDTMRSNGRDIHLSMRNETISAISTASLLLPENYTS